MVALFGAFVVGLFACHRLVPGFAAREPGFLAPRAELARGEAPAILSPAGTRLGGFRGPEAPEYAASPHSVAGDYFSGDYAYDAAAPESEVYLPTPAGPATYREAPAEPTFEAPAEPPVTWHAQPLILPPPPTAPATPQRWTPHRWERCRQAAPLPRPMRPAARRWHVAPRR